MKVKVLYFGVLGDMVGASEELLETESSSTDAFFESFSANYPQSKSLKIRLALNGEFVEISKEILIKEGDELALMPPFTGG